MRSVLEGLLPAITAELTEAEIDLVQKAEKVAEGPVRDSATETDRSEKFPNHLRPAFFENGLMSMQAPADWGGAEASLTTQCLVTEAIARVCASTAELVTTQGTSILVLLASTDQDRAKELFQKVKNKEWFVAFALTEPESGSDAGSLRTAAKRTDEGWVINGTKDYCSNGGGAAELHLVFARTSGKARGEGISTFAVETANPGMECVADRGTMGLRGSVLSTITFSDAVVPEEALIPPLDDGYKVAMHSLVAARPLAAAAAVGLAAGALDYSMNYALNRKQFGVPITDFQALRFMLADMALLTEQARTYLYETTEAFGRLSLEDDYDELSRRSSIAKAFATDVAMKVTTDAVQVMGGQGWLRTHPVERMMRDAKAIQIFEGTNQIQRLIISKQVLKSAGAA